MGTWSVARFAWFGVVTACGAGLAGCQRGAPETAEAEVRPVRSVTIAKREGGNSITLSGRIAAEDEVAVAFRISGRLIERTVNVGDRVRPGQVIARLEQMNERNQLLSAQAALNAANADLVRARDEFGRQKSLIDEGFTTRAQLDQATAAFRAAEAQVKSATAQVSMAQDLVGFTVLTADAAGAVVARGAEPGEVVQAGQMIVRIAIDGGVDAVFEVPPQVVRRTLRARSVAVALTDDPQVTATGRVREISPQADPVTGTFTVRVGLENPPDDMLLRLDRERSRHDRGRSADRRAVVGARHLRGRPGAVGRGPGELDRGAAADPHRASRARHRHRGGGPRARRHGRDRRRADPA